VYVSRMPVTRAFKNAVEHASDTFLSSPIVLSFSPKDSDSGASRMFHHEGLRGFLATPARMIITGGERRHLQMWGPPDLV
jgi:hypothetical protein